MVSLVAVFIFMYLIYRLFTDGVTVSNNYWHSPELFELESDIVTAPSLEWTQTSPPTFHTYEELPYLVSTKN
jgi:heme/copper-type cytochrome/quinol oxidase subunit 1